MLELHQYNTYGEDISDASTSSSEDLSQSYDPLLSASPVTTATEPKDDTTTCAHACSTTTSTTGDELDESVREAIGVLTTHQRFMDRQRTLADQHRKRSSELPRTVPSRRVAESASTGGTGGEEEMTGKGKGCGRREVTQAEKNRKRKLKKRKAKEKRFKLQET